ncbi:unnamed protein product, partial [Ixodes persulcatus]
SLPSVRAKSLQNAPRSTGTAPITGRGDGVGGGIRGGLSATAFPRPAAFTSRPENIQRRNHIATNGMMSLLNKASACCACRK